MRCVGVQRRRQLILSLSLREDFTEEVIFRTLMLRNSQQTKRAGFCRKAAQPWGAEGAAPVWSCRGEGGSGEMQGEAVRPAHEGSVCHAKKVGFYSDSNYTEELQ